MGLKTGNKISASVRESLRLNIAELIREELSSSVSNQTNIIADGVSNVTR
jgi:hypothetical protein